METFEISINGHIIPVPPSVYRDLSDLNVGSLSFSKGREVLLLKGGDAAASYLAEIEFDSTAVKQRIVQNEIKAVIEKTAYFQPLPKD